AWSNGEAESAKDSEIDSAILLERLAAAELLVKQLHERLENVERRPAASPPSAEPEAQPPTHIHPVEPTPYAEDDFDEEEEDDDEKREERGSSRFRMG